ncbi:NPY5R protein, partial [Atractosteus spatula]|nr:NPY5R protein [Atractosteus spatula]
MDLEYPNGSEVSKDNTSALFNSDFPLWEDFNSSVDDVRYFLIGLYTFISILGLLGNILILTALTRKWKEKTIINFLVGNLAFSDILVVLFCAPFTLTCVLLDHWVFGEVMCHIVPFLQCVSVMVSTLVLMSIAIVRYHMISHPLSRHLSLNAGYILLGIIWTLALSICSPLPVFHKTVDLSETFHLESLKNKSLCIESWPSGGYRTAFTISLLFVQYILPVVCLTVSHASVCRRVSSKLHKMLTISKSISRMKKRSKSVFFKLTIVVLAFAISWMPLHIFHLVTDFSANHISSRHFKLIYCICHLLGMLSCCLNPVLYGFLNNGIKSDLLSLLKCFYIS